MSQTKARKYHGLLNQGATCYLNSVLQVLFMTEDFREAVKRHTRETCGTECIDPHLASLFDDLKGRKAYTYNITKNLGIDNVCEQRDAAEYFEKILGLTSSEASQIFHGQSTHKTKCSTCCAETEAGGAFWYLPLALVDSNSENYSVVDGIKEYFRTSDFSGENQMYCDECDAKTDATIKCVIKHHPEVLMLLLKRFEFDYRYMRYVKINRTVDVPCTLQIPENQTYELYAVVDHFGDLRCGHYIATIKPQEEERWYKFNDAMVTLCKHQPSQVDNIEKSGSAYLLFYRKKTVHAAGACTQDREVSIPGGFPPATSDNYDQGPDVIKRKEREEVEEAAEVGNEPTVTASTDRHEETGIKDTVSVGSRGGGLSVGHDYDRKPVSVDKHRDWERMEIDDQVEMDRKSGSGKLLTKRDVKGNEQQKRGDDKHAQRKGTSERQQQDQNRRLDDDRQNRSEHVSTHKGAAKQAKEQEKKGDDEHHQRGADSSFRQAGSSTVIENRGSVEKSQPKAINEDTMEGRHGSKQSKTLHEKIIDEETRRGVQTSSETKNITIEPVAGTSQGGITSCNEGSVKRKSDPKTDAKVKLSEGVGNLKLNDSPSPKRQKQAVGEKHAEKKRGEKKRRSWRRFFPLKQNRKEKKKCNKPTGCFSLFRKRRKNADQTSESD